MSDQRTKPPQFHGYSATGPIRHDGPISSCRIVSNESSGTGIAEWIDARNTTGELFSHVRNEWKKNSVRQPIGSLRQHFLTDTDQRLARIIDVPRGRALHQQIFKRPFELRHVLETAISLTTCLEDWHRSSRVHGWLSARSIFRDPQNQIELRDVPVFEVNAQHDFLCLPLADLIFISPESSGLLARDVSPASDLYSVGAIVFGMLSAIPPIQAANPSDYFDRQLCFEPPRLRELGMRIPASLDDIVARLLRRDPRNRYQSASALLHDLERVVDRRGESGGTGTFAIGTQDLRSVLTDPSLVGREEELSLVDNAIHESLSGVAQVRVVTGSEVGYRRMFIDEVALRAKAQGSLVLRGGASSIANLKPLQSLESVLSEVVTILESDPLLAASVTNATYRHAATLSNLFPALSPLWESSTDHVGPEAYGSQRAAVALADLFDAIAKERRGIVLLFDDLDIADDLTQTVVRATVDRVTQDPGNQILCLVTCSNSDSLNFVTADSFIYLAPLSSDSIGLHLESTAGKISETIKRSIAEISGGSPLMAASILGRMIDTHVVTHSDEGWISDSRLQESLRGDESFAELLEHQIGTLSEHALRLLATAAVIGRQFHLPMVADASGVSYSETLDVATDASTRRLLLRDARPGWFLFANDAVHQKLKEYFGEEEQLRIHNASVDYLNQHHPSNVFDLAYHYDASGQSELALRTSLEAARIARQRFSLSVAQDQLRIAKRWVSEDDLETALEISEGLGTIHLLTGQYAEADQYLYEALEMCGLPYDRARIQQQIGEVAFKRGQFAEAATCFEHALTATGIRLPQNPFTMICCLVTQATFQVIHTLLPTRWIASDSAPTELDCLRLSLLSRLSRVYWFSRDKLWTLGNHLRSLNHAERFATSGTLAAVYSEHGPVMSLLRWFRRANRYVKRSLSIRTQLDDVWGQGQSLHYHCVVMLAECRFEDAIATAKRSVELLRQTGDVWEMNMALYQEANALYRVGRSDEASAIALRVFESGRHIGDLQATGIILDVWARTKPQTLAIEVVTEEAARSRPDAQSHAQTQLAYAVILLHHNRIDEAIVVLNDAIATCRRAGHLNTYISPCYAWLGTAMRRQVENTDRRDGCRFQDRVRATRSATKRSVRLAKRFPADQPHALRERAIVSSIEGNLNGAIRYLRKSLQSAIRLQQPVEELESLTVLRDFHEQHSDRIGTFPRAMFRRIEELLDSTSPQKDVSTLSKIGSTNLSLADRFVNVLQSGRRIAQALSPELVYGEMRESARRLLHGQHADVVSFSLNGGRFVFEIRGGSEFDRNAKNRIDAENALIRQAIESNQVVCRGRDTESVVGKSGSAIAAPISFRGEVVAAILVTHHDLNDLFGDDERRIADFVTTLAGAALENADGFLQLQQLNDTLEQRVLERTKAAEDRAQQLMESNERLRATEDQLRDAIVEANSASEAKSRFLATMSHEIRTPLNGILGMTRLARLSSDKQRYTGYLETVEESGQSLLVLINDLLDFSKLEADKMELERIPVDFEQLAREVTRLMAASAWQKNVELVCDIDLEIDREFLGDPSRIRQILMNLIGNAIKFTEQGTVGLAIKTVTDTSGFDNISISVHDSGIGIPEDQLARIFESFSQADSSTTRRYGGTGLGLAICRELVERMQGKIEVVSTLDVGSTFTVTLPIEGDEPMQLRPRVRKSRRITVMDDFQSSTSRPTLVATKLSPETMKSDEALRGGSSRSVTRVLVAEDGSINQEVIVGILEMQGYEVLVACDGLEAVALASKHDFDICLMDVDMPKMDGIEATQMIRKNQLASGVMRLPIIAMTAHSDDQIWETCRAAGMDAYLPKPIDPDQLFRRIEDFCPAIA